MTKARDWRDQTIEELDAACDDQRKQLFDLINERQQTKQFEKPHRIRQTRKEIARILTIRGEKQRAQQSNG